MDEQEFYTYFTDEDLLKANIQDYSKLVTTGIPKLVGKLLKKEYQSMPDKVAEMKLYCDLTNTLAKLLGDAILEHTVERSRYASERFLEDYNKEKETKWA